jgi:hypothetical protein
VFCRRKKASRIRLLAPGRGGEAMEGDICSGEMGEWRGFGEGVKCFAGEKRRLRGSGKEASEIKGGGQSTASV